jgi:hypothetical protein
MALIPYVGGPLAGGFGEYPDEGLAAAAAVAGEYQHEERVILSGSDRAELYILRNDGDRWIWDYAGPVLDEAEAINALDKAKRRLDRSGDKRHIAAAIRDARVSMSDEQIAAELGVSVEWVAEHARDDRRAE